MTHIQYMSSSSTIQYIYLYTYTGIQQQHQKTYILKIYTRVVGHGCCCCSLMLDSPFERIKYVTYFWSSPRAEFVLK